MLAIQYLKSVPRWVLVKALGGRFPGVCTGPLGVVRLCEGPEPPLPGPRWARVRPRLSGICGSDLAAITARGSTFFGPLTSFPFTLGHEVVGVVGELGDQVRNVRPGDRVVVEPALPCAVRGIEPPCRACERGHYGNCTNVTLGPLAPGLQIGYCAATGGGWSGGLVAHEVQLHKPPDAVPDEAAVLVEPFSCALHAVLRAPLASREGSTALVIGCGTMGLLTVAALRALAIPCRIIAWAKHRHQQALAAQLGAHVVVPGGRDASEQLCKLSGAKRYFPELGQPTVLGGFDVVFDCVGSSRSLSEAVAFTRSQGTTVLVGMPGIPRTVDWTNIWYKELNVKGAYVYGWEDFHGERLRTFELALRFLRDAAVDLRPLVTHRFALSEYRQAIRVALQTGPHQSIKTIFDLDKT
jgi:threonine dehydrogenase-like Zn-dependent dehydrogenase